MKPRQAAAPWTKEDSDILWRLIVRGRWAGELRTPLDYREDDRRAADTMAMLAYAVRALKREKQPHWWVPCVAVDQPMRCLKHGGLEVGIPPHHIIYCA